MLLKMLFALASPAGQRARLSILIFHRVLPEIDPLFPDEVDAGRFDMICGWLNTWFNVLPLTEGIERLKRNNLPARAAAITFDDGYADNFTHALPILNHYGLHATFFIATGFLDGGRMWNDTIIETIRLAEQPELDLQPIGFGRLRIDSCSAKRAAIDCLIPKIKYLEPPRREDTTARLADIAGVTFPNDLMLSATQLKDLHRAGMGIGAHTVSHPILACTPRKIAKKEIVESRDHLEELLGEPISLFAYPNGKPGSDYRQEHVEMVHELGFDAAVSTAWGAAGVGSDFFQLPRFTPWDKNKWRFGMRMLKNFLFKNYN